MVFRDSVIITSVTDNYENMEWESYWFINKNLSKLQGNLCTYDCHYNVICLFIDFNLFTQGLFYFTRGVS